MKVLIIGSSGYMGKFLYAGLVQVGIDCESISSSNGSGINPQTGLLSEKFIVSKGTNVVVYMSQSPYYNETNQASHVLGVNVISVVRAAVAAREAGVSRFIYLSTGSVYAPSFEPLQETSELMFFDWYSLSKIHGEQAIQMFSKDMEVIVVRPFGIYGPGQVGRLVPNLVKSIVNNQKIQIESKSDDISDNGGLKISLCHINDATKILIHLITNGGPNYLNLAGNTAFSIREIVGIVSVLIGIEAHFTQAINFRKKDLVADTTLLQSILNVKHLNLKDGLIDLLQSGSFFNQNALPNMMNIKK